MNATIASRDPSQWRCPLLSGAVEDSSRRPSAVCHRDGSFREPHLKPADLEPIQVGRPKGKVLSVRRFPKPDRSRHHVSLRDHRGGRSKGFRNQEVW